jgi:hypothetical protein
MKPKNIMVVIGEERREETELGPVDFRPTFEALLLGLYSAILDRLRTGKRTRRAHPDAYGAIRGSATHRLSQDNESIVKREHPRAEWHYMKIDAYPVHIFVATENGVPVAIAACQTSRSEDFERLRQWDAQQA